MSDQSAPVSGQRNYTSDTSPFNAAAFIFKMLSGEIATATLVQVQAVHPPIGLNPDTGSVDVLPLVNQIDGEGVSTPHGTVPGLPIFRLQGGGNAVICDPIVGDIGIAVFASRDISSVKKTLKQSNPGSRRRFDYADGMYIGGLLNETPTQYVQFLAGGGINVVDKFANSIETSSSGISITDVNGNMIVMGAAGITINGILFQLGGVTFTANTHLHPDPQGGNTGTPIPVS